MEEAREQIEKRQQGEESEAVNERGQRESGEEGGHEAIGETWTAEEGQQEFLEQGDVLERAEGVCIP